MQLGVIGHPVGHSISPAIFTAAFAALGIDASYEAWSTLPEALPAAIARLREPTMLGMNVTVPHKSAVLPLLDAVDPTATTIGAVNCISKEDDGRLVGHNTDHSGFLQSLEEAGCRPASLRVVLIGNGGAARAVAYALIEAGVASVAVAGRSRENVDAFIASLDSRGIPVEAITLHDDLEAACAAAGLIVNCTTVGMRRTETEGLSPLPEDLIPAGAWAYDLIYNPAETAFLRQAREAGGRPISGLEMLVLQAATAVRIWTGREPPVDIMRNAARAALAAME